MLKSDVFFRILNSGENHLKYIKEFIDTYNLPYRFTDDDSNTAPSLLAKDGHLVVKTSWDYMNIAVFYVPSLITDNQKRWLDINLNNFKGYEYIGFNNYSEVDGKVIEEKIEDFDIELSIINKRYLKYNWSIEELVTYLFLRLFSMYMTSPSVPSMALQVHTWLSFSTKSALFSPRKECINPETMSSDE